MIQRNGGEWQKKSFHIKSPGKYGIELESNSLTPGSAIRPASVARHDTDCATWHGNFFSWKRGWNKYLFMFWNLCLLSIKCKNQSFNVDKVRNLRPEHLESYSNLIILYIRCSGPVVECLNKINMLQSKTQSLGQNRTMRTVWKAWITFKMLCPQMSNFFHIKVLLF